VLCLGPISEPKGFARTAFDYGQHPLSKIAVREVLKTEAPRPRRRGRMKRGW